jgi:hypothetical protein
MPLRGTTLVDHLQRWPTLPHDGSLRTRDRAPPGNGGDSGTAYLAIRPFGARLTDPFSTSGVPGLHHPRFALPAPDGAYSLRSVSLRSFIAGGL